ncbi:GIY-YIG nuclease family protein [Pontibacter rugosus]|uniref:GIY-YIG nuclease family protein n=1 Tax=Pontibacter rugosus TaxID=1745966 RepID=A0ABW3SNI5_9BACT
MKFGKTIKIFLIDGDPNGRMTCELSNWTGKAYRIPRVKVKECIDRQDLNNPGIYLLFGKSEDGFDKVYVGEAEEIFRRLQQQVSQRDFWNEAITFISKDENLNKAHIKYIENRLHTLAKDAGRYQLENSVIPTQSSISESDRAEMEEFISNIRLLVNTLGHKVFEEKREVKNNDEQQPIFYLRGARGAEAQGEPTAEGFVVFKGSRATLSNVNSISPSFAKYRQQLIEQNILQQNGEVYEFMEDSVFSSPSTAAVMVMGRNANGLLEWKLPSGVTLKEFESENR